MPSISDALSLGERTLAMARKGDYESSGDQQGEKANGNPTLYTN